MLEADVMTNPTEDESLVDLRSTQQALTGTGVLKVADTAANLRSTTGGTTTWVAALQGLGAANDAGGGTFYWSTTPAADDGWSVLNNGSGNSAGWRRIRSDSLPEGWFSVKDPRFGAKGTGSVDDTVAIQACIDFVAARGGGLSASRSIPGVRPRLARLQASPH
jgi:hypothetical protein